MTPETSDGVLTALPERPLSMDTVETLSAKDNLSCYPLHELTGESQVGKNGTVISLLLDVPGDDNRTHTAVFHPEEKVWKNESVQRYDRDEVAQRDSKPYYEISLDGHGWIDENLNDWYGEQEFTRIDPSEHSEGVEPVEAFATVAHYLPSKPILRSELIDIEESFGLLAVQPVVLLEGTEDVIGVLVITVLPPNQSAHVGALLYNKGKNLWMVSMCEPVEKYREVSSSLEYPLPGFSHVIESHFEENEYRILGPEDYDAPVLGYDY